MEVCFRGTGERQWAREYWENEVQREGSYYLVVTYSLKSHMTSAVKWWCGWTVHSSDSLWGMNHYTIYCSCYQLSKHKSFHHCPPHSLPLARNRQINNNNCESYMACTSFNSPKFIFAVIKYKSSIQVICWVLARNWEVGKHRELKTRGKGWKGKGKFLATIFPREC